MKPARSAVVGFVVAMSGVVAAGAILAARERVSPLPESLARLMYVQSENVARRAFLSFDALAADIYWMRTIQHYGRDRRSARTTGRFELLQPLLNVTTTLDPQFNVAYRFGAIFLASDPPDGPARPDQAIQLLEKGLKANPERWQYAHDIGFIHYWYSGDYRLAADWFERAGAMPKAPDWIRPLAALTRAQGGDKAGAERLLSELLSSDQPYIKRSAERSLAQLHAIEAIERLQQMVERYRSATGALPASWSELIQAHVLPGLPADTTGAPFHYEPGTGTVSLSPDSKLAPLPRGLTGP